MGLAAIAYVTSEIGTSPFPSPKTFPGFNNITPRAPGPVPLPPGGLGGAGFALPAAAGTGGAAGAAAGISAALSGLARRPVPLPFAAATILGAAILGYAVGKLNSPANGTAPASQSSAFSQGGYGQPGTYGTGNQACRVYFRPPINPCSVPVAAGPQDTALMTTPIVLSGAERCGGPAGGGTTEIRITGAVINQGDRIAHRVDRITILNPDGTEGPEVPNRQGLPESRSAPKRAATALADGLPGFPAPRAPADPVAGKAPQQKQVPALTPGAPPVTQLGDPKTGNSTTTKPGTGSSDQHNPGSGQSSGTTKPPTPQADKKQDKAKDAIALIPTVCPSPCPEIDLQPVLNAVADVFDQVIDAQNRIGFANASQGDMCEQLQLLQSAQSYLEFLDLKINFRKAIKIEGRDPAAPAICNVSEAVEAVANLTPVVVNIQGYEVPVPRNIVLLVYFSPNPKRIDWRSQLSIPNPPGEPTRAEILAAVANKQSGAFQCFLRLADGSELQGFYQSPSIGETHLRAAASLSSTAIFQDNPFSYSSRPGKGMAMAPGTILYPVRAQYIDASAVPQYTHKYDLRP